MTTMMQFTLQRQKHILDGHMGHSRAGVAAIQRKHIPECQNIARAQARANASDPFCYDRVMSHLLEGTTLRGDYSLDWAKKREEGPMAALSKHLLAIGGRAERTIEHPINRKLPTYC